MRGLAVDLLERGDAFDVLARVLREASDGESAVVTVSGEAGIGKTTLLHAALAEAPPGLRILSGSCDDLLTARPLGPVHDVALETGGALEAALVDGDIEAVFGALVAELRRQAPAVLVIEDLQWADDASLDVFAYLVRRIAMLPAALIFTIRDRPTIRGHPLFGLLGASEKRRVHAISLTALSVQGVATLARGTGWDPKALHELTAGNPFFVSELLAAPRHSEVPDTVAAAVLIRAQRLNPACRAALERLSVVPRLVEFGLAEALLGPELVSLAEAEEAGLLNVDGHGISFRHELARRSVEASVSTLRRRVLHADVARALVGRPEQNPARIVHHYIHAGDVAAVCHWAAKAGRESAAAGSHRQALEHFEAALRFADESAAALTASERARVWDDYGWELYNAHRFEEAVRAAEHVLTLLSEPDSASVPAHEVAEIRAETLVRLARYHVMLGNVDAGLSAARRAMQVLTPQQSPGAFASASTTFGSLLALGGDARRAATELERAERLATEAQRPDLVALCLNYQSIARRDLDPDARIGLVRRSLRMALAQGHQEVAARGYTNLVELLYRYGRLEELRTCLADGLSYTEDRGFRSHAYNLKVHGCLLQMRRGEFAAAMDGLVQLIDEADGVMQIYSRPSLLRLTIRTCGLANGSSLLDAWQSARELRFLSGLAFAGAALAEWSFLEGRKDVAERLYVQWQEVTDRPGFEPATAEVLRYCERAGVTVDASSELPMPWLAGIKGDWRSAADEWGALGERYEQALELADSGEAGQLLDALSILDQLGAGPAARLVRRRLKALGMRTVPRGPMPHTRANPVGLTRRESDVLELLLDDLTNAQIAHKLVLSVRTVEHHVASILTKFGVRSREAVKQAAGDVQARTAVGNGARIR